MKNNLDEVAIFWDYENCPAPINTSGYTIVDNIRSVAQAFGSIKLFKAYLEVSEHVPVSRALLLRSELQSSGVSLTDCPHNGRKDVADKMIIVDMLAHATDNPAPSTIVLISGDRDFAYALSILRLRRYHIVLITLSNAHPSLRAQASLYFDWILDVLGPVDPSFLHQPTSSCRGKTSVPPAPDKFHSDTKGHNTSRSLFQESYDEKPANSVEPIKYSQDKTKCKENCLTPPRYGFRPDFSPPDLEPSKKQPATSVASSTLRNESESPARAMYSPVAFLHHAHFKGSTETPLTMTSHSSRTTLSSAESTPKLAPYGSITSSQFSARMSLRGYTSLPNLALEHEVASVTEPVSFESTMQTRILPPEPDLREPSTSFQQQRAYSSINAQDQSLSTVNQMDDRGNPYLPPAHLNIYPPTNITVPLSSSTPSFMPLSSLSHTIIPPAAQSPVKAANPPQPPPPLAVPDKFKILVQCLKTHQSKGTLRPLRSIIALEIARNGTTYKQAGVLKFREYAAMAEKAGIIKLGGLDGKAWIALMESWYNVSLS